MTTGEMNVLYVGNMKIRHQLKYDLYCNFTCKVLSQFILYPTNSFFSQVLPSVRRGARCLPTRPFSYTPSHSSLAGVEAGSSCRSRGPGWAGDSAQAPRGAVAAAGAAGPPGPPALHTLPGVANALTSPLPGGGQLPSSKISGEQILTFDNLTFLHVVKYSSHYYAIT